VDKFLEEGRVVEVDNSLVEGILVEDILA